MLEKRARDLSSVLVGWASVTGTRGEADFPHHLAALLRQHPYFAARPEAIALEPVPGGSFRRSNLLALARGRGRRTVLLCGHFDVVSTDDYGTLEPLALDPARLREALVERLRRTGENSRALEDLESGAFLPGRGLLDMKSGIAAGIAVIEAFAAAPGEGNLLLVATPDEENQSAGMRALADALPAFLADHDLDPILAINLDAICDEGEGVEGRVVTMGCIGKLLLGALVIGHETHAAYPFAGVNAAHLAAEIVAEIECLPALGETTGREVAAPPTVLALHDGKTQYNVTTPVDAWAIWNVLIHRRSGAEVLDLAAAACRAAYDRAAARVAARASALGHAPAATPWVGLTVLTWDELARKAAAATPGFEAILRREAAALATRADLDLPSRSRALVSLSARAARLGGPAVVLCFASTPYPAIRWPGDSTLEEAVDAAIAATVRDTGVEIEKRHFFPAIADMSFLGSNDGADLAATAANTPLWGSSIEWQLDRPAAAIPIVNAGPWGRDYHHWLERTHVDYTFRVLPQLVQRLAHAALAGV